MPKGKGQFSDSVLFVSSEIMGRGEDHKLGSLLMMRFLHELCGRTVKPGTIIFMNSGVKLVAEGSLSLEEIKQLESQGVAILACGTCLSHLQLTDKIAVGKVSNMSDISDILLKAEKVIST